MNRAAWEAVAAGITLALGALFHFTYAWSGRSAWVKWFSAKDESVVAHLSLVHVPFLAMTVLIALNRQEDVWLSRAVGFLVTLLVIPAVFYGYTAATGHAILVVDILTFALAIALGGLASWLVSRRWPEALRWKILLGAGIHAALFVAFVTFAYTRIDAGPFAAPT